MLAPERMLSSFGVNNSARLQGPDEATGLATRAFGVSFEVTRHNIRAVADGRVLASV